MTTIKKLYYILWIGVGAVTGVSCTGDQADHDVTEEHHHEEESDVVVLSEAQLTNAGVVLGGVENKQLSATVKVNGYLDVPPQELVSVSVPLGGFLKNTTLLQGSRVRKGQVIAVIENPEYIQIQQDYLEAKSQLEFAQADYERQQALAKENVNAEKTLQQAKSTYQTWQAKVKGLTARLKIINVNAASLAQGDITGRINLYAPISGYVTEVNVNIGKYVNPTDVIFEIVDTGHLHAELVVFERDIPKIKIGQRVRFTLANETKERMATVYLIGREISQERTVRIHCHLEKEDALLLPGMYLKALVETGEASVPALPSEAIVRFEGKQYIFVPVEETPEAGQHEPDHTEGQHFQLVEVLTGHSEFDYTEVTLPENLSAQTQVVVKGAYALLSKMKNSEEEGGHAH